MLACREAWAVSRHERLPLPPLAGCKGSRFLTHLKRLREQRTGLTRYFDPVRHLRGKLGPVLWQLPPSTRSSFSICSANRPS